MTAPRLLRLAPSAALKQKRLAALLGGREPGPELAASVADAQLLGSLELAGFGVSWDEVRASRRGEPAPEPVAAMHRALAAVAPGVPFSASALAAWHRSLLPSEAGFRSAERIRESGPPAAPAAFIESRLRIAEEWLSAESASQLTAPRLGALALARVVEIAPFDDGNGRVARLAASHLMVRAGARPPVLVGADRGRLEQCLAAAFRIETEPLASLLEEASERALDVMIQTLERG